MWREGFQTYLLRPSFNLSADVIPLRCMPACRKQALSEACLKGLGYVSKE
jgi:hypothetical protein